MKKISFLISTLTLIVLSCRKSDNPNSGVLPPQGDGPTLPATSYNYVSSAEIMPEYLRMFVQKNQSIDNNNAANPITNAGATLGRVLFYDKNLSVNNTISCGSCHHQDKAFTDGERFSKGFEGKRTSRNAMPVFNLRYFGTKQLFWDLRADKMETQVLQPITDHIEMGMPSLDDAAAKLRQLAYYPALFQQAFGSTEINADRIARALAQFIRSIVSFQSKYDEGLKQQMANLTPQEQAGLRKCIQLNCTECHSDLQTLTPGSFPSFFLVENVGLNTGVGANNGLDLQYSDQGIGAKTRLSKDMGTFKMPSLRNVELTAPYMHDGRFATLEQVMDHYQKGVRAHPNLGIQIPPGGYGTVVLSDQDKANIIAFLKTLTDRKLTTDPKYANPFK